MVGVGKETVMAYRQMNLNPQPGGKVTASRPDGQVLSIQPDGSQGWRPVGTAGPFELATPSGDFLIYAYMWTGEARIFKVALIPDLPELS